VRLRVLEMSEWDTVLKAVHKVHVFISVLTFASGTCCMLQPSTIYPYPSPAPATRRYSTSVLKHDYCYYLKQFCLHSLFLYIIGCKDKIRVFCVMREAIFARRVQHVSRAEVHQSLRVFWGRQFLRMLHRMHINMFFQENYSCWTGRLNSHGPCPLLQ
jgi:hypothetical protein